MKKTELRVLGLIPARGGSKGVPGKNIRPLGGKPLLAYTAEAAHAATLLDRVVLSTDNENIRRVGMEWGLDAPFLRPAELARDDTPTLPVVQHALRFLADLGEAFEAVCLLQPTSPFRPAGLIDACIEMLSESGADTVMTVLPVPAKFNPHWVYFQGENGALYLSTGGQGPIRRRQELPPAFHREGSVYVSRTDVILNRDSFYGETVLGYPVNDSDPINIDSMEDWKRAEQRIRKVAHEKKPDK